MNIRKFITDGTDSESTAVGNQKTLVRALDLALEALPGVGTPRMTEVVRRLRTGSTMAEIARCLGETTAVTAHTAVLSADEIAAGSSGSSVLLQVPTGWVVTYQRADGVARAVIVSSPTEERVIPTTQVLRRIVGEDRVPVIVLEPRLGLESLRTRLSGSRSPWLRLRALLALERTDLFALTAYAVVLGGLSITVPIAVQVLVNTIAFGSLLQPLVVLSTLLFGVLAFSGVIQVFQMYTAEVLQRRMFVRVAEDFSRRLPMLGFETHDTADARELSNRFFEVVSLQKTLSQLLVEGLGLCLQTLVAMLLLAFYHPFLLVFDVGLIGALLFVIAVGYGAVSTAVEESQAKYRVAAWLQEIAAQPVLFSRSSASISAAVRADALTRDYLTARRQHYVRLLRQQIGGVGIQVFAMVMLLGIGGWLVMNGELTLGQLVAAELVVGVIGVGFSKSGKHIEAMYDLLASLEKIGKVIDQPIVMDGVEAPSATGRLSLTLCEVRVSKSDGARSRSVNVDIHAGARMLLGGGGGTGKSSLLEALAGLRPTTTGTIRVDPSDNAISHPSQLRERAWLLLSTAVVEGTLLENLRLGDLTLDDRHAWQLLNTVKLHERVAALPDGLHTALMPRGGPLSSSEVARLCLARALAAAPDFLLVDGALDGLGLSEPDMEEVLDAVLGPNAPWTAVLVSNDIEVRKRCDMILSMDPESQEYSI